MTMTDWQLALPPLTDVPAELFANPTAAARFEWIEPDGDGGWAAGTAVGANTRREHGLLVVARADFGDRFVLLSRFEEVVIAADGERYALGCNFYPGAIHPEGYRALTGFSLDPWPVWRYRLGDLEVVREVFRSRRAGALLVRYRIDSGEALLETRPLFAGRGTRSVAAANDLISFTAESSEGLVAYRPYDDAPAAVLTFGEGEWEPAAEWFYRTVYPREEEAGDTRTDDLFSPGVLHLPLREGVPTTLACGIRPARVGRIDRRMNEELARRETLAARGRALAVDDAPMSELAARLACAADAFMPRSGTAVPVATGFPSGGFHVRDALVALPWLARITGRSEECLGLLRVLAGRLLDGLLPDVLGDGKSDADERASVDVPLWFIEAIAAFGARGHDVARFWPAVQAILDAYVAGTTHGIGVDAEGLLRHGPSARPLTWMDAELQGQPVTPRTGRAVEVNALWHNALLRASALSEAGSRAAELNERAAACRDAFAAFWCPEAGWLADTIDATGRQDRSLRPNQLLALSLPHPILTGEQARTVVQAVESFLLVPAGVRSLAPSGHAYDGRCGGPRAASEARRHLGAAWPFWIGPFARAYLRVHDGDAPARRRIRDVLLRAVEPSAAGVVGHLPERVCAEPPHRPDGNLASAWSTAGLIEAMVALTDASRGRLS